jgi:putative DNA primase/helicase
VSIHRTYLEPDGSKAKVAKGKMVMSSTIPDGSAIRLMPYTETLGVTEGIETAFSASAIFDVPVWATISASVMVKWHPPASIRHVIIFGDNDQNFVGQLSAYRLAYTLAREHPKEFSITVCIPNIGGADWNDVLALNGLDMARKEAYIAHPRAFRIAPA